MGITIINHSKEGWNCLDHVQLPRIKQEDKTTKISSSQDSGFTIETRRLSICNISRTEYGFYHIELSPHAKQLCMFVLPWGKYEYKL
jgi:hypothetical protein